MSDQQQDRPETICAVATPPGRGGIGIVRISGPDAFAAASLLCRSPGRTGPPVTLLQRKRGMTRGTVVDSADGGVLDDALLLTFPGPHSYTGEDSVEIHCHGSPAVLARVLELCLSHGARLADPGEFTLRAFRNGRIDLTQAEAVLHVVNAETAAAAKMAAAQVGGVLGRELSGMEEVLRLQAASIEAAIDFPDDEIESPAREGLVFHLRSVLDGLAQLAASASAGRLRTEGATVAIAGRPNAGKSTLFNALLGRERAIVAPEAGTTRDVIEAWTDFAGMPVSLRDTAGLRAPQDGIEAAGVRLARETVRDADLVLLVVDAQELRASTQDSQGDHAELFGETEAAMRVTVLTKCDLLTAGELLHAREAWQTSQVAGPLAEVSGLTGAGLSELRTLVAETLAGAAPEAWSVRALTTVRQEVAVRRACDCLNAAIAAAGAAIPDDLLVIHIYEALAALREARGGCPGDVRGEVVQEVFARFCVGK